MATTPCAHEDALEQWLSREIEDDAGVRSGFGVKRSRVLRFTLRLKIAQKSNIIWSLGPKALKYESLEP